MLFPLEIIIIPTDETEFNALVGRALAAIVRAPEASSVDCDCEFKGEGVLEFEFNDRSKIVVNRHGLAREICINPNSLPYLVARLRHKTLRGALEVHA